MTFFEIFAFVGFVIGLVNAFFLCSLSRNIDQDLYDLDYRKADRDDLDAHKKVVRHSLDVLNTRYADMRPTIVISNLKLVEITNYLGTRIIDRLSENGGQVVPFKGAKSFRQGAKA